MGRRLVCHHQQPETVATCFSLSNKPKKPRLKIKNRKVPLDDTPTYLGVRLDKRLTWRPQIQEMEKRGTNRLSLMKQLAGTGWGASGRILRQVFTGNVRPVMEYASAAWATAAPSNTVCKKKIIRVTHIGIGVQHQIKE